MSKSNEQTSHKRKIIPIKGMHCRSCEILIEDELMKIDGVKKVYVSEKKGMAEIIHTDDVHDTHIEKAINNCGYSIGKETKSWISKNPQDYDDLIKAALALFFVYFVARGLGFFNIAFNSSSNLSSLPVIFLVGLTAGLSTCMALVGGLVLGVSARFSERNPFATPVQKFTPHLFFNAGRIFFFLVFGSLIGFFGSLIQLGPTSIGILTILVGVVMLLLGLQTISIFPILDRVKFTLPKGLYKLVGMDGHKQNEYSNKGAFIMGGLTFFLPCGFTQAMQLYAISSGSAMIGALTMGIFALGTTPGLLGIGGLTSVIKGAFAKPFFKFVGLMVIGLSLFNISNGLNLAGLSPIVGATQAYASASVKVSDPNVALQNGVQIVKMTQTFRGYSPRTFTIQKGIPVKWIINSVDSNSCAASIASSQLGIRKALSPGENIIEFTPQETGNIRFSCTMGMYTGSFTVVDAGGSKTTVKNGSNIARAQYGSEAQNNGAAAQGSSCSALGGGCGCGGGAKKPFVPNGVPVQPTIAPSEGSTATKEQLLTATYDPYADIQPNNFTVKVDTPVRFEVLAKEDGAGCMGSIALPGLSSDYKLFQKGQKAVFSFTPTKKGTYQITCAMGIPRGVITVN